MLTPPPRSSRKGSRGRTPGVVFAEIKEHIMAPVFASQKMGVLDIADAYGWREQTKLLPGIPTLARIQLSAPAY